LLDILFQHTAALCHAHDLPLYRRFNTQSACTNT